jgi:hypothetical protein
MKGICSFNLSGFPPELRLILACLRLTPNGQEAQRIEKLSQTKLSWPDFLWGVDHHRVAPLVYVNLSRYAAKTVPASILSELRSRFEKNAQRALANTAELVRLYKLFHENGIPVIPLKGSVLALQVYGDLALRHAGDIDLLVDPLHLGQADRLLQEDYCRMKPGFNLTPYQQNHFFRHMNSFAYSHRHKNINVELHYRLLGCHYPLSMDSRWIHSRPQYVLVAGLQLPAMSPEDIILYLCAHGAIHIWYRLFWLVDLSEIVRQEQGTDWEKLIVMARKFDIVRPLVQGVLLSHLLCNSSLPDPIRAYAALDRGMNHMIRLPCRYISRFEPDMLTILDLIKEKLYFVGMCVKFRDKINLLHFIALGDPWTDIPLPDTFSPLYYILRPFLFLYRRLRGSQDKVGRHEKVRE